MHGDRHTEPRIRPFAADAPLGLCIVPAHRRACYRAERGRLFPPSKEPMPGSWDTFVGPDCLQELHVFRTGWRPNITNGTGAIAIATGTATGWAKG